MSYFVIILFRELKLKLPEIQKLGITKDKIQNVVENPIALDKSEDPVYIVIGRLTDKLSLCVAYRRVEEGIRVITFYPAEKGRYESKIL